MASCPLLPSSDALASEPSADAAGEIPGGVAGAAPAGAGTVVGYSVPADQVIVKVAETGSRCACPRASVCSSRQAYEATHTGKRELPADR